MGHTLKTINHEKWIWLMLPEVKTYPRTDFILCYFPSPWMNFFWWKLCVLLATFGQYSSPFSKKNFWLILLITHITHSIIKPNAFINWNLFVINGYQCLRTHHLLTGFWFDCTLLAWSRLLYAWYICWFPNSPTKKLDIHNPSFYINHIFVIFVTNLGVYLHICIRSITSPKSQTHQIDCSLWFRGRIVHTIYHGKWT